MIATAKIFTTGNSQAIRLPKAFRLDTEEVWIGESGTAFSPFSPSPKKMIWMHGRIARHAMHRRVLATARRRCPPKPV